jgi:hypothetical protein
MTIQSNDVSGQPTPPRWRALAAYLVVITTGDFAWETLHLPLYTLWRTGTPSEKVYAVLHCTGGDILIASASLFFAIVIAGDRRWPAGRYWRVAWVAIVIGLVYTMFSEWLNIVGRATWAYTEDMPVLPLFGFNLGLSPVMQWIIVPSVGFCFTRAMTADRRSP